ncbi:MAG: hypothetical protein CUN55_19140, partial [Phototrophicales bacterium]
MKNQLLEILTVFKNMSQRFQNISALPVMLLAIGIVTLQPVFAKDKLPPKVKQALMLENYAEATPQLQLLHRQRNSEATYQLALCYLEGKGVTQSLPQAISLLKSIESTSAKANFLLANLY